MLSGPYRYRSGRDCGTSFNLVPQMSDLLHPSPGLTYRILKMMLARESPGAKMRARTKKGSLGRGAGLNGDELKGEN